MAIQTGVDGKVCPRCQEYHPYEGYSKDKCRQDGYCWSCKRCAQKRKQSWDAQQRIRREATANTMLAFGDLQCPAHHPDVIDILKYVKHYYSPCEVIDMGDEIDGHNWSDFLKNPDEEGFAAEIEKAKETQHQVYQLFPKGVVLHSNHVDVRYDRMLKNGKISRSIVKTISEILETPKGWVRKEEHISNGILFRHGHKDSKNMKQALEKKIPNRFGQRLNMVNGHHHESLGLNTILDDVGNRKIWGIHTGCLVNKDHRYMSYSSGYEQLGLLIIQDGTPLPLKVEVDHEGRWTGRLINTWSGNAIG